MTAMAVSGHFLLAGSLNNRLLLTNLIASSNGSNVRDSRCLAAAGLANDALNPSCDLLRGQNEIDAAARNCALGHVRLPC